MRVASCWPLSSPRTRGVLAHTLRATLPFLLAFSLVLVLSPETAGAKEPQPSTAVTRGHLTLVWEDPQSGTGTKPRKFFLFTDETGSTSRLSFSQQVVDSLGGLQYLSEQPLELTIDMIGKRILSARTTPRKAGLQPKGYAGLTGSLPWISIPCKYADVPDEPKDLAYFLSLNNATSPGLDHYWQELSYGAVNIAGSTAINWVTVPEPRSYYVANGDASITGACLLAADPLIDFTGYYGFHVLLNDELPTGNAWGGGWWGTLDGEERRWGMTLIPPWGYANHSVIAHETGHAFNLPHSTNADQDGDPYDSPWDVMSDTYGYALLDPIYGYLGKHTISYHKYSLGWINDDEIEWIARNGTTSAKLQHLESATASAKERFTMVLVRGRPHWYAVESRDLVQYDAALPGKAVLIYEIDVSRVPWAWVLDADDPPADYADTEGVMWRPGETFQDPVHGIDITVDAETADGFQITVTSNQDGPLYLEDYQSGELSSSPSGLWHITTSCEAVAAGHSAPEALYYGEDSQCNYHTGASGSGLAKSRLVDLKGISPPINLHFNYFLETDGSDFAAVYLSEDFGPLERIASNLSIPGETLLEDPTSTWRQATIDLSDRIGGSIQIYFYFSHDGTTDSAAGFFVDDVVVDGCFTQDDLTLTSETVATTRLYEACNTISASGFTVASSGVVTFRASKRIILGDGFAITSGGSFTAEIAPPAED